MIQTSYFNYVKNRPELLANSVSIAIYYPKFIKAKIQSFSALAPDRDIFNLYRQDPIKNESLYYDSYNAKLDKLNAAELAEKLDGKILCCYESEPLECHRRIFAEWFETKTGIFIPECGMDFKKHLSDFCEKYREEMAELSEESEM